MRENIEKSIKRWLKRKVTITLGMMVAFMITGEISYSEITVKYDEVNNQGIIIKGDIVIDSKEYGILEQNSLGNYSWYNNNSINDQIKIDDSFSNKNFSIINSGIIYDKKEDDELDNFNVGNGIFLKELSIKLLENSGIIFGEEQGIYLKKNVIIDKLENEGIIGLTSENGVYLQLESSIETFINKGEICSYGANYSGNGMYLSSSSITNFINLGSIKGKSNNEGKSYTGNGIYLSSSKIENFTNIGIVSGKIGQNISEGYKAGNGIFNSRKIGVKFSNFGIIAGEVKAIHTDNVSGENLGLLIDGAGKTDDTLKIVVGESQKIIISGEYNGYEIKNTFTKGEYKYSDIASRENDITLSDTDNKDKLIINGYNKGLKINSDLTLSNSIVNSYTTAINIDGGNFTGDNIVINGGIDETSATIKGSDSTDNLTLKGNSIINGNIDLGAGDDNLTISDSVQINGDLLDEDGNDTLTFNNNGVSTFNNGVDNNINIFNKVEGFENINVATDVTLFESAEVTGADSITIQKDGNLILRIDSTNGNSHALSGNTGVISSEGGKLLLALNGVGEGETIDFGNNKLDSSIKGNEIGYTSGITLDTTSLLHSLTKGEGNTVIVNTVENLPTDFMPTSIDYSKLNSIYQSMRITDQVKEFDVTDDKKLSGFTSYLNDIYAGNPYSFSSELSRKSINMFSDVVMGRDLHSEVNKWAIYGGLTHIDGGTKDTYFGKGYYTYDIGSKDIDVDSKITGMYAQGEYGVNETLNLGVIFGGNQSESEINSSSKVEGDSFYLGAYAKKYLGNLRLLAGVGYQYGDYEVDRVAVGYEGITTTRTFDSNYNDNTFNIYAQGKYSNKLAENLYLEPSVALDYTYVNQEGASENGVLAIETDSKDFNYTTAKFGVDLRKDIPTTTATHSLVAGAYYNRMLDGYEEENITGRFVGGSDFDILVSPSNKHEVGLRAKYEVSLNNGVTFDVKGSYTFERESYSGENKNEHKGEWIVGAGIGYRF
ncbi:autotransporter domain-containing protein [Fusobacterium mortiferum]|uniref:autotransporter domain-containing protein n=1 Tax=Fusobacterium mortiferum TaxID=850 RepID=UPI000E4495C8|nr:autotransporter domain-containing protein [Fusobacterium mortiferum]RGM99463.1 autotransporter outer membrane beta-barrel domain-containing protein [Fusobacterium mortiferum]